MEKNPKDIHEALYLMRTSIANQQAVYGASKSYYHRQVSFEPPPTEQQKKFEQMEDQVSKLTDMVFSIKQTLDDKLSNRGV